MWLQPVLTLDAACAPFLTVSRVPSCSSRVECPFWSAPPAAGLISGSHPSQDEPVLIVPWAWPAFPGERSSHSPAFPSLVFTNFSMSGTFLWFTYTASFPNAPRPTEYIPWCSQHSQGELSYCGSLASIFPSVNTWHGTAMPFFLSSNVSSPHCWLFWIYFLHPQLGRCGGQVGFLP